MNTDSSQFITGREVAVLDMLNARDRRHAIQQELIRTHNATVISFTLNIPGPIKVFPLGEMTFEEGIRLIDSQLHAWKIPVLEKRTIRDFTGNEQFWSVKGDTLFIKEILCLLEDSLSFGRLFDIDVIRTDETKVSRTELGFPGRKCLLCSNDAFVCSRSRTHTVKELLDKACELMKDYFEEKQAKKLSSLSMQALLYEVSATPKPGLVDRNNTGAHKDMDIFTFEASAVSLNHYFEKFALCGMEKEHENGHEPFSRIFARLRSLGIQAEDAMMTATKGINTHKGLIFSLAILNCSLGYMYANHIPYSPDTLLSINRKLVADVLEDFKDITAETARTNGERLYALYGMKGARGEAISGYSTVLKTALPILKETIHRDLDLKKIAGMVKTRIEIFPDIKELIDFFEEVPEYDVAMYTHKKMKTTAESSLQVLKEVLPLLKAQEDYSNDALYEMLCAFVKEKGYKNGYVMWPIRTAASGKQMTPCGATEILEILGKEESIARIEKAIEKLS